jgi:hypothetical protein
MFGRVRGSGAAAVHPVQPNASRGTAPGQSMVELALILPLLVMLLAIGGDFGRALTAHIAIGSAAREGAAYGMLSSANAADQNGMREAALGETPSIWNMQPTVSFPACTETRTRPNGQLYECVAVTVHYDFQPIIRIWPIPATISMERTVEMRVVN